MTIKNSIQRPPFQSARPEPTAQAMPPVFVNSASFAALMDYARDQNIDALKRQKVRRIPRPEPDSPKPPGPGALRRAFSWLHRNYVTSATKQLRVAETVSLGEKRFVAIIHAEGHKYLVGGGATGVSLLAQLSKLSETADIPPSLLEFTERSA
jgi:hypothetical protein